MPALSCRGIASQSCCSNSPAVAPGAVHVFPACLVPARAHYPPSIGLGGPAVSRWSIAGMLWLGIFPNELVNFTALAVQPLH